MGGGRERKRLRERLREIRRGTEKDIKRERQRDIQRGTTGRDGE